MRLIERAFSLFHVVLCTCLLEANKVFHKGNQVDPEVLHLFTILIGSILSK